VPVDVHTQLKYKYRHSPGRYAENLKVSYLLQATVAMAPVSFDLLRVPFYGLVAGVVVITWSLAKIVRTFQGVQLFLVDSEPNTQPKNPFRMEVRS
jgi:hypothetical protein